MCRLASEITNCRCLSVDLGTVYFSGFRVRSMRVQGLGHPLQKLEQQPEKDL